mgnify:FL=1
MKESLFESILNFLQPRELTAGEAIASFVHKKDCPAFGMELLDSAEFLQIGQDKVWMSGDGGSWGGSLGSFVNITYIQCSRCGVRKVFQEKN